MNNILSILSQINNLLDELIQIDLKFNTSILSQIIYLILQIKSNINFLISEFYFTNIIEFETKKNQILHKLIFIKNLFFINHLSNHIIEKINNIKNMVKQVFYPAYLNINNINKYIKEIEEIKHQKIKFYHKSETICIKDNFYDEELEFDEELNLEYTDKIIYGKNESYNNKNYVINKIRGKKFLSKINFSKSYINI